jgi:hypothetical protein
MKDGSTKTLPLGTLVRGEKFARKFRLTDVPATVTPTWRWTRKKHKGDIALTQSKDTQWELTVSIDSASFEEDGDYTQNLIVMIGDEKQKITVTFSIARQSATPQAPLIIDNTAVRPTRMVWRRRMSFITDFEAWAAVFIVATLIVIRVIGGPVNDAVSAFVSNLTTAASDIGTQTLITFSPHVEASVPQVTDSPTAELPTPTNIPPTLEPTIAPTQTPTVAPTATVTVCTNILPSHLEVGASGTVSVQSTSALRLRSDPTVNGSTLYGMTYNTVFAVIDGPVCADGYRWWLIRLTETLTEGWAAENNDTNYFLAPTVP